MADALPVGMQLERVHKLLKAELRPLSSEEVLKETGVDIESSPEILLSLTGEASRVVREKDGRWRWKSAFYLRNFNGLLTLLARSPDGILEKHLLDSYKGVREDIKKLKNRGAVYEIKSGSRVILFPRDSRLELDVAADVKEKYGSVRLPDAIEIHRYLVESGLKETEDVAGATVVSIVTRKRPKRQTLRRSRKIKLTNTHMANSGIDLNKDFNPGKDSAFG